MCCSSVPTMPSGRIMVSLDASNIGSIREGLSTLIALTNINFDSAFKKADDVATPPPPA